MLKFRTRFSRFRTLSLAALMAALWANASSASPVLLAGSGSEKVHSTDITLMEKDGKSVVTVLPDYQGPLSGFAVIIPVPKDVTANRITTLKREYVDRVALVSAPRFAEFWEMDPCDTEKVEQTWERDMTAKEGTGFLGVMKTDPSQKVAKEMLMDVEAKTKEGEYKETFVGSADALSKWLEKKEYDLPEGGAANLKKYEEAGYQFLALDVDVNRIELVGGDRALLSPIRFWTDSEIKELPTRFGLPSAAKAQELEIFTFTPDQRMQASNYETKAAPTNLRVVTEYQEKADSEFNLKEKTGELYAALHDRFLEKHPKTFLMEYAFSTDSCGQPCATEPLLPHELLSLGADVFEAELPKDVTRPDPGELSAEEEAKLQALLAGKETAKEKKEAEKSFKEDRAELAARKAMLERNTYVLTRLHYRYAAADMPEDVKLGPGAPIKGGMALPEGEFGAADSKVAAADKNEFQTRYNGLFPNKVVVNCDNPQPHRWGKPPRSYRGLNKVWVAEDLSRRNRTRVELDKAVMTAVPDLAIAGISGDKPKEPEVAAAPASEEKKDGGCGCQTAGLPTKSSGWLLGGLVAGLMFLRRRRSA